ncbi:MAG: hypothetical protein QM730_06895 [Anaerolineales bacterium]
MNTPSFDDTPKGIPLSEMYEIAPLAATILNWFTTLVLVGILAGILILFPKNNIVLVLVLIVSLPLVFASYYFIRRQKYELVAVGLALYLLTLSTVLPGDGLGIHSINIIAYPIILVIVSMVSRKRMVVFVTLYTLACVAKLVIGEAANGYAINNQVHSILGDFVTAAIILIATVFIVSKLSDTLLNSLSRLHTDAQERKTIEEDLRQREMILEAVTFSAEQFLKMPAWRSNIDLVLERLGKTLHVTHAYLFEDHLSPTGEALTSMRYEWTAPGYVSDLDGEYFQNSPVEKKGFEEQVAALKRRSTYWEYFYVQGH